MIFLSSHYWCTRREWLWRRSTSSLLIHPPSLDMVASRLLQTRLPSWASSRRTGSRKRLRLLLLSHLFCWVFNKRFKSFLVSQFIHLLYVSLVNRCAAILSSFWSCLIQRCRVLEMTVPRSNLTLMLFKGYIKKGAYTLQVHIGYQGLQTPYP